MPRRRPRKLQKINPPRNQNRISDLVWRQQQQEVEISKYNRKLPVAEIPEGMNTDTRLRDTVVPGTQDRMPGAPLPPSTFGRLLDFLKIRPQQKKTPSDLI